MSLFFMSLLCFTRFVGISFLFKTEETLNLVQSSLAISVIENKMQLFVECLAMNENYNEYLDRILIFM